MPDAPITMQPTPFQERLLALPEAHNIASLGGRGGGKTVGKMFLATRHIVEHRDRARVLFLRRTHAALTDAIETSRAIFGGVFGAGARLNANDGLWRFGNGASMAFDQLETPEHVLKFLGKSYSLLIIDELTHWPQPDLLDRVRASLRAPAGVPVRIVVGANPGLVGHAWVLRRHVLGKTPWVPYLDDAGASWITAPSTFRDNPALGPEYEQALLAATQTDAALRRAWIDGDWFIAAGGFFESVLDEKRSMVEAWSTDFGPRRTRDRPGWELSLAYDHGSAAPAVGFVVAKSPGAMGPDGRYYARGSLILIDELATCRPGSLTEGMGYVVPRIAEELKEMAKRWRMRPEGCADDACFAQHGSSAGSIADEFRREGVYFSPAKKADRNTGWTRLRTMMAAAGSTDRPGFYAARQCEYFWATLPNLPRDPRRPDDVDSRAADHAADAARYAVMFDPASRRMTVTALAGTY